MIKFRVKIRHWLICRVQTLMVLFRSGDRDNFISSRLNTLADRLLDSQMKDRAALGIKEIECHIVWGE